MNLQPINPPLREGQAIMCFHCGKWTATLADLDGKPFGTYYCAPCAVVVAEAAQATR
jgi:hypothetical protein